MWSSGGNKWLCIGIAALTAAMSGGQSVPYHKHHVEGPAASASGMELVDPTKGKGRDTRLELGCNLREYKVVLDLLTEVIFLNGFIKLYYITKVNETTYIFCSAVQCRVQTVRCRTLQQYIGVW